MTLKQSIAPHAGDIVGFRGHRAAVHDVDGAHICVGYVEQLPNRHCDNCFGEGWIERGSWTRLPCEKCRGTGELPAEQKDRIEWVSVDDLEEPPARDDHPMAAEAAALIANPRAVLE